MTETKLPGMVINRIDKKSTYDSLVKKGEIGENDLCLVEDEDNISPGSGTDISLGITGAAVGDIVKVKAVDDSGKPTAWEAAGMHSAFVKDTEMTVVDGATNALLSLNGTYNKVLVRVNTDNSEALTTDAKSMYCGFDGETTYAGSASKFTKGNSFWFLGVYIGNGNYLMFEWVGNNFYTSSSVECIPLGVTNANGLTTFKINQYGSNQVDLTGITITAYREEII